MITTNINYVIFRLVTQGFQVNRSGRNSANSDTDSVSAQSSTFTRRIPVTNPFLIELLNIVYNAMERGINAGQIALSDIIQRASYEAYPGKENEHIFHQECKIFITSLRNKYRYFFFRCTFGCKCCEKSVAVFTNYRSNS